MAAIGFVLPAFAVEQSVPLASIACEIDAVKFVKEADKNEMLRIKTAIGDEFRRQLVSAFPFIEWRVESRPVDAMFRVRLTDHDTLGTVLVYETRSTDENSVINWTPIDLRSIDTVVYRTSAYRPVHDPNLLQNDLAREIIQHFTLEKFRDFVLSGYVSTIPIADKIYTHDERVVVLFEFARLRAEPKSKLAVRFDSRPSADAQAKRGQLTLTQLYGRTAAPYLGYTEGAIDDGHYPGIPIEKGKWPAPLEPLLREAAYANASVTVAEYAKGPAFNVRPASGLAVRP